MSTPAQWAELVTTALLGTDRRPVEGADPPGEVLRLAARHRVLDRLAAPAAAGSSAPETRPPVRRPRSGRRLRSRPIGCSSSCCGRPTRP